MYTLVVLMMLVMMLMRMRTRIIMIDGCGGCGWLWKVEVIS